MSLTLDKLKALRRQAGGVATATSPVPAPRDDDARVGGMATTLAITASPATASAAAGGITTGPAAPSPLAVFPTDADAPVADTSATMHARIEAHVQPSSPCEHRFGGGPPLPAAVIPGTGAARMPAGTAKPFPGDGTATGSPVATSPTATRTEGNVAAARHPATGPIRTSTDLGAIREGMRRAASSGPADARGVGAAASAGPAPQAGAASIPTAGTPPCAASTPAQPPRPAANTRRSVFDWIERGPTPTAHAPSSAWSVPAHACSVAADKTAPAASGIAAAMPASARGQPRDVGALRRLLATRERLPATPGQAAPRAARHAGPLDRHLPGSEIAPGLWKTEVFLPQPVPATPLPLAFAKRPDDAVDPRDLLFFDTETTGLAGGTGTRAFMIGAADWHVDAAGHEGLRVRQLTMATLGAEPAMLREFAGWLDPRTVLSSYNGRCYDAPLLKTRYRLARLAEPLSALDHVDLLFPSRRYWRGRWENCRLATIERQVLGIVRQDDLPGSEAPAAWLRFLRGGSAVDVRRVAAHNHQDVVTLARLFLQLVHAQAAFGDTGTPAH